MAADAELLLPANGEEKGPKRLRVGTREMRRLLCSKYLLLKTRFPHKILVPLFAPSSYVSFSWRKKKWQMNKATWKTPLGGLVTNVLVVDVNGGVAVALLR